MIEHKKRHLLSMCIALIFLGCLGGAAFAAGADSPVAQDEKSVFDFVKAGGVIGYVIILLSFAGVAMIINGFMLVREDKLIPSGIVEQAEKLALQGKFAEVMTIYKTSDSMVSNIMSDALSRGQLGIDAVREIMQELGGKEITRLRQRIGYVGFIASVAPMLGLLGTVTGMISSFGVLGATQGSAPPSELAVGISEALVTTCMGLIVAIPLMFFHSLLRDRVSRVSEDLAGTCDRLLRSMNVAIQLRETNNKHGVPDKK